MSQHPDLLDQPVDPEAWLMNRLQDHGIDVYAGGLFDTLKDRLAWTLVNFRWGAVVVGRHQGKPETYEQLFERMYGVTPQAVVKAQKAKETPARIAREATS